MRIAILALLAVAWSGCGGSEQTPTADMSAPTTLGTPPTLAVSCSDAKADLYTMPSGLPAMDDSHRGDIVRCTPSESLSTAYANQRATALGYPGPSLPSGFWSWRISFRSLRATDAAAGPATEGDMAALLLVPEKPLPGAPLVVYAHPTLGIAPNCGPSGIDLSNASDTPDDYAAGVIPLAAYGYTVVVPDFAGYGFGQPAGYFNAEDEAHALLDATRAARAALPAAYQFDKVAIVGHSQGGHAAIAAQHYARSYGLAGNLVGVASYAPWWTTMGSFAGIATPLGGFNTTDNGYVILFAMFYFYSEGELRDGPGGGLAMFKPEKRALVEQTMIGGSACYDVDHLKQLGATPADFFDTTWVDQVGTQCADIGTDCTPPDAAKWLARWQRDRPTLDPTGAPMLVWYSAADKNVTPGFAQCARDRFATDLAAAGSTATVSYCYDQTSMHSEVPKVNADHVNRWIAARAGLGAEPTCAPFPSGAKCQTPPVDW
jgi:pimeloyl-ACP methyl ester carboxylesterase